MRSNPIAPLTFVVFSSLVAAAPAQDCGSWAVVPSPNPAPGTYSSLRAVSAASPAEAWAIGSTLSAADAPMVFRWDGSAWSDVAPPYLDPSVFGILVDVEDVVAFPGDRMWTAGVASGRVLALEWFAGAWVTVEKFELEPQTVYPFGLRTATTNAMAAADPDDIWIVGRASGYGDGTMSIVPMIVRRQGSVWTEIDPPWPVDDVIVLEDVVAVAPDDVWAVGWGRGSSIPNRGIVYHFDGSSWKHVPTPAFSILLSQLHAIDAVAADDIWAVGQRPGGALLMHWDGGSWTVHAGPFTQTTGVEAVAAVAADDVWAVATQLDTFLHWDGSAWSELVPPAVPGAVTLHRADVEAVGPCDLWAVGHLWDGSTFGAGNWPTRTPLVERQLAAASAYCTAGASASGCSALIAASGTPSASASEGFALWTAGVEGGKDGLYFFGANGRQANPWGNGSSFQCVLPPVARAGLLDGTGTAGACDGFLSQDLNALWCPTCPRPQKNPGAGAVVQAQLWYRDPSSTSNQTTSLSDATEFTVQP